MISVMKRVVLFLMILSLAGTTFAQKRTSKTKKRSAISKNTKPKSNTTIAVTQTPLADTSKKAPVFASPIDGYYKKTNMLSSKPSPYTTLREADVVFSKRIWREIDLREKMNQYMSAPQARLIDILVDAIKDGELTAYDPTPTKNDPNGDKFLTALSSEKAMGKLADSSLVDRFDKKTGDKIGSEMKAGEFNPDSVVRFRIKEDWIFDKQNSVFQPRIIGIAPLIKLRAGGTYLDFQPAFWIYFPDARQILASKQVVRQNNDATGLSYDQVFLKRIFSSYIVKQSNEKDERIKDYAQGIDRLYESERIKKTMMDWELNLWQY